MKTILIYLKSEKRPFEISFENKSKLEEFYDSLTNNEIQILHVGPLVFTKSEFKYCLQK